ncbi:MAG: HD domain-containing protein [Spirochaetes bacterium]|nr:HD domain-containing protein [Spirochaetota bacterium]
MRSRIPQRLLFCLAFLLLLPAVSHTDDKEDSKKYYEEGRAKYTSGDLDGAIALLDKAFELDNRNFKAQKLLAENLDSKGKQLVSAQSFDQALEAYKKAYKLWPNNAEIKAMYEGLKNGTIQEQYKKAAALQEPPPQPAAAAPAQQPQEEIKKQLDEAEQALTEISKTETPEKGAASPQETQTEKALQEELERQKQLIAKMKSDFEKGKATPGDATGTTKSSQEITDLLFMYQQMLAQKTAAEKTPDLSQFVEVMKQYRMDIENKNASPLTVILLAGGSSLGLIIIILLIILVLARVQKKRRRATAPGYAAAQQGYYGGLPQDPSQPYRTQEEIRPAFLIGSDGGDQGEAELVAPAEEVSDAMYKDLLKYEKLKSMHSQMKTGNLNWDTVRENIDILHNDLQTEILKIVEMKLMAGDVTDYSEVLPVLFPFLTSGNDYLRKKSNVLAYKVLESEKQKIDEEKASLEGREGAMQIPELKDLSDIKLLAKYAETLDRQLGRQNHCLNVANYAKRIGVIIGLEKSSLDALYKAGLVHDFGYFLFDEEFCSELRKTPKLSQERLRELSLHPEKGMQFFSSKNIDLPKDIGDAILFHHERNDGTGYPKALLGEQIPLFGKIIAVVDVFESMMSDRPYREKMNFNSASIVMRDLGRNKLDLTYINALIEFFKKV